MSAADSSAPGGVSVERGTVGIAPEPARVRAKAWLFRNGIVMALLAEIAFFWVRSEKFMTAGNIRLIFLQVSVVGIIAVPSALLLLSGYIDFAVGATLGLCAVVLGEQMEAGLHAVAACAVAIAVGAATGAAQGLLATKLRFAPIIVTLGFYTAVSGLVYVVSEARLTSGWSESFQKLGQGLFFNTGIPNPTIICEVIFIIGGFFHIKTRWGRYVVALGVNAEAARRAGINPHRLPFILYVMTGIGAAVGAIIMVSRLNSAPPTLGEGDEIKVLSAVLLGGVAFGGGRGNLLGVAAGVLFIGILNNGLLQLGVSPFWVMVSSGAALVAAATLDAGSKYFERRSKGGEQ